MSRSIDISAPLALYERRIDRSIPILEYQHTSSASRMGCYSRHRRKNEPPTPLRTLDIRSVLQRQPNREVNDAIRVSIAKDLYQFALDPAHDSTAPNRQKAQHFTRVLIKPNSCTREGVKAAGE